MSAVTVARGDHDPPPEAAPVDVVVRWAVARVLDLDRLDEADDERRLADLAPIDSLHLLEIISILDHHLSIRIPTETLNRKIALRHLIEVTLSAPSVRDGRTSPHPTLERGG